MQYEKAVENSCEERSTENLQLKSSYKTVIALTCSKFETYFRYLT